jgi:prepilin-type processing-associated H-X9-DG protein
VSEPLYQSLALAFTPSELEIDHCRYFSFQIINVQIHSKRLTIAFCDGNKNLHPSWNISATENKFINRLKGVGYAFNQNTACSFLTAYVNGKQKFQ